VEKTKPDLMAATSTQRPASSKRILAQLEHGPRQPARPAHAAGWTIDGWTIGLFALLLLMCSVAWMMHDQTITPKTFRRDYSGGAVQGLARRTAESAPAHEQPANIVNEAAPSADVAAGAGRAARTADADTGDPTFRSARAAETMPKLAIRTTAAATPAGRAAAMPATAASPAATASPGDSDVTLLTALMAHASKPAAVTPERPRDVVERQEGDTTAQLLARCKQLGLIEGMLCRSRICSGRWEGDAACRAPSH
jgi:hypothetical protein